MSENQSPETTTDDVQGHGITSGRFQPDPDATFGDDVEGHRVSRASDEDVEGHGKMHLTEAAADDDVEGHLRSR